MKTRISAVIFVLLIICSLSVAALAQASHVTIDGEVQLKGASPKDIDAAVTRSLAKRNLATRVDIDALHKKINTVSKNGDDLATELRAKQAALETVANSAESLNQSRFDYFEKKFSKVWAYTEGLNWWINVSLLLALIAIVLSVIALLRPGRIGPQGDQGPAGPPGPRGPQGERGGLQGTTGTPPRDDRDRGARGDDRRPNPNPERRPSNPPPVAPPVPTPPQPAPAPEPPANPVADPNPAPPVPHATN